MRKMRKNEGMGGKGQEEILGIAVAVGILIFAFVASMLATVVFLRIHLVEIIVFKYKYDNTKQALQTLMSLTREAPNAHGGYEYKRASKIVGEYLTVGGSDSDVEFLDVELGKMVNGGIFSCYKLTAKPAGGAKTLAELKCGTDKHEASKYKGAIPIATSDGVIAITLSVD